MKFSFFKKRIFVILVILFFIFSLNLFSAQARDFFYSFFSPIETLFWKAGSAFSDVLFSLQKGGVLGEENKTLKQENIELRSMVAQMQDTAKENEQLRMALGLGMERDFAMVQVDIIGKEIGNDTLIVRIPQEYRSSIREGLSVVTAGKVAVGKIAEVSNSFAKVTMLSHPKSAIDVKIPEKGIAAILKGEGRLRFSLEFVKLEADLRQGDTVVTSALGGIFPENIFIGKVEKVMKDDQGAYQRGELSSLLSVQDNEFLFIILSP
ncbi:MAG: rod shape-determining protein MreC [Candidatus Wildermuthbacteria bacterium]|nr:rod shape-determining protein MreC [Candidatus Wildermuthbacteria bacterium]